MFSLWSALHKLPNLRTLEIDCWSFDGIDANLLKVSSLEKLCLHHVDNIKSIDLASLFTALPRLVEFRYTPQYPEEGPIVDGELKESLHRQFPAVAIGRAGPFYRFRKYYWG